MAKLVISSNGLHIKDVLLEQERITIGRNSGNDIVLYEPVISGEHAALRLDDKDVTITDLESTNGTLVNGKKVKKIHLQHNDVISIGNHELRYIDKAVQDFSSTVVLQPASDTPAAQQAALKIINGPRAGEFMPINKQRTTLGNPGMQVAVIMQQGSAYQLLPMKSAASGITTRINGKPVGEEAQPLNFGDEIEIADVRLLFMQGLTE